MSITKIYKKAEKEKGFTLVEMVIYVSFLAVFSVMVVSAVVTSMSAFVEFRLTRDINNSATTIMERFVRDVRIAYDVDQTESTLSSHPGRLTLNTTDEFDNATTTEF
ncbi:MAG: type II secretion system protein, partial [Candidatus Pacebacteria bacterium]|nr:type II secretion system protein [Candidatus Paceibacterota bacterium]